MQNQYLRLTIEATHLDQNHWFVDAAFAVHNNLHNHTAAYATIVKGMIDGAVRGQ